MKRFAARLKRFCEEGEMYSSSCCSRSIRGWLAACGIATATIYAFLLFILVVPRGSMFFSPMGASIYTLVTAAISIFVLTVVLSGIPASAAIWLSERFRIRSLVFFGGAGAVTGALSQAVLFQSFSFPFAGIFILAGFLAGLEYWFVAGKHAGREPD
jgi:hypothetical protein